MHKEKYEVVKNRTQALTHFVFWWPAKPFDATLTAISGLELKNKVNMP